MDTVDSVRLLRVSEHNIIVLLDKSICAERQAVTKALIWLCQTLRNAPESAPASLYTSAMWNALKYYKWHSEKVLAFILKPLERLELDPRNSCWRDLFQSGIVSYLRPSRDWGVGLEIPFEMMVQLAAVENYFRVEDRTDLYSEQTKFGGYLLYGYYTALIPTEFNPISNSIQWHFESSRNKIINPRELQSTLHSWFKCQDYSLFASCTCFVGWCERAKIVLGTRELPNTVGWSGLPSRTQTLHKQGMTFVGQLSASGPIPIQASIQVGKQYAYVNNVQHFSASKSYAMAIQETSRQVALVYDALAAKAWLVPKLSLLLHLCHTSFAFYRNTGSIAQSEYPIPFARPSCDGSGAAYEALFGKGDTVMRWHGVGEIDKILLRHVLVDINANISDTSRIRELPNRETFLASELMNMIAKPRTANGLAEMTSKGASSSWFSLIEHVDAVFVCTGLGAAIRPVLPASVPNCLCAEIPEKKDFLAAHVRCLKVILQRRGINIDQLPNEALQINKNHHWSLGGQPFQGCPHNCQQTDYWAETDSILQKISKRGFLSPRPTPSPSATSLPITGAVIFGSTLSRGWLEKLEKKKTSESLNSLPARAVTSSESALNQPHRNGRSS